jgi:hypothetical protein
MVSFPAQGHQGCRGKSGPLFCLHQPKILRPWLPEPHHLPDEIPQANGTHRPDVSCPGAWCQRVPQYEEEHWPGRDPIS